MSNTKVFNIKQGDYHRRLLLEVVGLDVSAASSVSIRMTSKATGEVFTGVGEKVSSTEIGYQFVTPQLEKPGVYLLTARLVFGDGPETVPTVGKVDVVIEEQ